jgi:anthranilate synthase component 2
MIVLIDNYDSFTYNLVQKLGEVDRTRPVEVFRNDKVTIAQVEELKPTHIVISPGPCTPREGGVSNDIIRHFGPRLPVLGVCLGHQAMVEGFGGKVVVGDPVHGKGAEVTHDGKSIYEGLPAPSSRGATTR